MNSERARRTQQSGRSDEASDGASIATAWAAPAQSAPLERTTIQRRAPRPRDVVIEIAYAGICHSDIHTVRGEWGERPYPLVPGHEITGHVTAVGSEVTSFAVGDRAGVGVLVDSCRSCEACEAGEENYCERGMTGTYGAPLPDGSYTQGGYSTSIVVDEHFAHRIPDSLDLAAAAPLLCAGITTYSPLKHWNVGPGSRVAVIGLGGLGHLAVKLAVALGAEVTVLGRTLAKRDEGLAMGAAEYLATTDDATFTQHRRAFDLVLNTVSANLDLDRYLSLVARSGVFVEVGLPEEPLQLTSFRLINPRLSLSGSSIGGIPETQEMLELAAEHGIAADIELIDATRINEAFDRVVASDVRYRFVIDVASMH